MHDEEQARGSRPGQHHPKTSRRARGGPGRLRGEGPIQRDRRPRTPTTPCCTDDAGRPAASARNTAWRRTTSGTGRRHAFVAAPAGAARRGSARRASRAHGNAASGDGMGRPRPTRGARGGSHGGHGADRALAAGCSRRRRAPLPGGSCPHRTDRQQSRRERAEIRRFVWNGRGSGRRSRRPRAHRRFRYGPRNHPWKRREAVRDVLPPGGPGLRRRCGHGHRPGGGS